MAAWTWEQLTRPDAPAELGRFLDAGGSPRTLIEIPPPVGGVGTLLHGAVGVGSAPLVELLLARGGAALALTLSSAGEEARHVPPCAPLLAVELLPSAELVCGARAERVRPVGRAGVLRAAAALAHTPAGRLEAEAGAFAALRAAAGLPAAPSRVWVPGDLCEFQLSSERWVRARVAAVWARDDVGVQTALAAARRELRAGAEPAGTASALDCIWRTASSAAATGAQSQPQPQAQQSQLNDAQTALRLRWVAKRLEAGAAAELRAPPRTASARAGAARVEASAAAPLSRCRVVPVETLAHAAAASAAAVAKGVRAEGECPSVWCAALASDLSRGSVPIEQLPAGALVVFVSYRASLEPRAAAGPHDARLAARVLGCARALAAARGVREALVFVWLDILSLPPPTARARLGALTPSQLPTWALALGLCDAFALCWEDGGGAEAPRLGLLEVEVFLRCLWLRARQQQPLQPDRAPAWRSPSLVLAASARAPQPRALPAAELDRAPALAPLARALRLRPLATQQPPSDVSATFLGLIEQSLVERVPPVAPLGAGAAAPRALEHAAALGDWSIDAGVARPSEGRHAEAEVAARIGALALGLPGHAGAPRLAGRERPAAGVAGADGLAVFGDEQFAANRRAPHHPNLAARKYYDAFQPRPPSTLWKPAGRAPLDPAPRRR